VSWHDIARSAIRLLRLARVAAARDAQLLSRYPDFFQEFEHVRRHAFWQIDEAVIVANVDATDVLGVEACFVGYRTDDIAGFDAVRMSDFDAERFEPGLGCVATLLFALR